MKKVMLFLMLIMSIRLYSEITNSTEASSGTTLAAKHELKIDLAYVLVPAIKIEYERLFSAGSTWGLVGLYDFDDYYHLLGFYRWYFGKEPISGFFLEGHAGVIGGNMEDHWLYGYDNNGDFTAPAVGVALGWKFTTNAGVVLDIFTGLGRLIGEDSPGSYHRSGICIGKRF